MNDTDAHVHALSGAYAIHALDDLEQLRFERHLDDCAECQAEVNSLREAAAAIGGAESVPPPVELRARVLESIQEVRPLPAETGRHADRDRGTDRPHAAHVAPRHAARRRRRWNAALAAAAAVIAVAGGIEVYQNLTGDESTPPTEPTLTAAEQVLQAPDAEELRLTFEGGAATFVRSETEDQAVMVTEEFPEPEAGQTYQLWLVESDEDLVSAGLVPDPGEPVLLEGDTTGAVAAAISVEPAGGSAQPTTTPLAIFLFDELEESPT